MTSPDSSRLLTADLILVGLEPASGRIRLGDHADLLVEVALVIDLVRHGRLALTDAGTRARVHVVDTTPVNDALLSAALVRLQRLHGPPTDSDLAELESASRLQRMVVGRLMRHQQPGAKLPDAFMGYEARKRVVQHLVSLGTLTAYDHRTWGIVPSVRHSATAERDRLVAELHDGLLGERDADHHTGQLSGLLGVANLVRGRAYGPAHLIRWAPRHRRQEVHERARQLAQAVWGDESVRTALMTADAIIDKRNRRNVS